VEPGAPVTGPGRSLPAFAAWAALLLLALALATRAGVWL
jgi:hypothetical protein